MDASTLRGILLGAAFSPRVEDIATPQLLLDQGVEPDCLRLVSMSAHEQSQIVSALSEDGLRNTALYTIRTLRMRDGGGNDGKGTYVFGKTDEQGVSVPDFVVADALTAQDFDLIKLLGSIVKPFLGLDNPAATVDAEKKDSQTTPSANGGSGSPASSESPQ